MTRRFRFLPADAMSVDPTTHRRLVEVDKALGAFAKHMWASEATSDTARFTPAFEDSAQRLFPCQEVILPLGWSSAPSRTGEYAQ
jgi:hypothetical protein